MLPSAGVLVVDHEFSNSLGSRTLLASDRDPPQASLHLIVLCGVVGSGKSTFSQALVKQIPNWARVNQDEVGDRYACEALVRKYLAENKNVIVDRQNFDPKQRRSWLEIASTFPNVTVDCVVMGATNIQCQERIKLRTGHPTVHNAELGLSLLQKFTKMWKPPALSEGFDHIFILPSSLPNTPGLTPEYLNAILTSLASSVSNRQASQQRMSGISSPRKVPAGQTPGPIPQSHTLDRYFVATNGGQKNSHAP